jgi:transcriptional repressor NrdR
MKCPYCRTSNNEVYNSRNTKSGSQIWRRRRCLSCKESFTTYETADLGFIKVLKKSGKRQRYSRAKIFTGVSSAFLSMPAKEITIEGITDTIEAKILDLQLIEVRAIDIASIVLSTLKHFDTSAFLRYLAYQSDISTNSRLMREIKKY